jgi:hypothetical protein
MSIAHVQGNANGNSNAGALTFAVTLGANVGSGNAVVGAVYWYGGSGQTLTSVTDDQGNNYTLGTSLDDTTDVLLGRNFYLGNITNAPHIITATAAGANLSKVSIVVDEYTGCVASANPTDGQTGSFQASPTTATDAVTSTAITTTANGDLIWGSAACFAGTTINAGTGFTQRQQQFSGMSNTTADKIQSSAGSVAATFTLVTTNSPTLAHVIALKAPAAGAGPVVAAKLVMM